MKTKKLNNLNFNISIGNKLRLIRQELGLSQTKLASILDVSFQQVQKYEKGTNRLSAESILLLCKTLKKNPDIFFDGLIEKNLNEIDENQLEMNTKLMKYFEKLTNENSKKMIIEMTKKFAENDKKTKN